MRLNFKEVPYLLVYKSHLNQFHTQKLGMCLIYEVQVFSALLTNCIQKLSYRWSVDVVLNKPFKDRMRQKWMVWMCTDDKELTKGGNLKRQSLSMVTTWVKYAWDDIPAEMVKKSFLKTDISNSMDGTEDD